MKIDLKKDRWFIRVNSVEESIAAQEWLFEQGITCWDGVDCSVEHNLPKVLTNYWADNLINRRGFMFSSKLARFIAEPQCEIKLIFKQKLSVSDVIYPTKESPQQAKIRELEETINKAKEQLRQLKEGV